MLLAPVAAASALAADLPPPPAAPAPAPASDGFANGWYLRADFTESYVKRPRDATPFDPADPGMPPLVGRRLSGETGFGGGVGYRFNPWLRVDATFDKRMASDFRAFSSRSHFVTGYNLEAGGLDVLTGLVTVYADLGTFWGLTPYIGAGLGVADTAFRGNFTQTTCILDACDGQPGTGQRTAVQRPNRSVTSFAWALTGGVSYHIAGGLSLDAAYRYIDLGTARSGFDAYGERTSLKGIAAQEFRIGLRYELGGPPAPTPPITSAY